MQTRIKQKFDLKNKVAIVTGASKGIGESIARGLAEYGAKVVISSRSQEAVDQVANNLKANGYDALGIACHVGDENQLKKLVEETVNAFGGLDTTYSRKSSVIVFQEEDIQAAQGTIGNCDVIYDSFTQTLLFSEVYYGLTIAIFNLAGQRIFQYQINDQSCRIDCSGMTAGVYVVSHLNCKMKFVVSGN